MTLNEAIRHAEEVAEQQMQRIDNLSDIPMFGSSNEDIKLIEKCEECAKQHRQLAEWLRDYKRLKEQKTGHWIECDGWDGDEYYECSVCSEPFVLIDGTPADNLYNYCPNCGAKMSEIPTGSESEEL